MGKFGIIALLAGAAWLLFGNKAATGVNDATETRVQELIAMMRANPEWLAAEIQKAQERGITLDEMLRIDALWMIEQGW